MMKQRHIINKQIIEVHLPKKEETFAMQQKLSKLYQEQFVPIIDALLSNHYGNDKDNHHQINQLTIDMGEVRIENMAAVFTQKLDQALSSYIAGEYSEDPVKEEVSQPQKTPLKTVSYYLINGRLPWWADKTTKAYLLEQLDQLLKKPDTAFKALLTQLTLKDTWIDRFLYTFTEEQLLQSLQLLANFPVKNLLQVKKGLVNKINKNQQKSTLGLTDAIITKTFWTIAFIQVSAAKNYTKLKDNCIQQTLLELGIDNSTTKKPNQNKDISAIRMLVAKHKTRHPGDTAWQHCFKKLSVMVQHPSFYRLPDTLLKELKELLEALGASDKKSKSEALLKHLQLLEDSTRQVNPEPFSTIEKLHSQFEETDFITVHNAGLVLLWPFLQRFFENLGLVANKTFVDEIAQYKAVCVLQYLCNPKESEFFEGLLPLTKVLCGIPVENPIPGIALSEEDKEIANGLLKAVIKQGPDWTNLSLDGFRSSYLCRQGSLRKQDNHWLIQVQKETYDITMRKLPWSLTIIKLPWMEQIIMVEW